MVTTAAFLLLFMLQGALGSYNLTASGGGLLKPGESLALSATTGTTFDRCYWYFPHEKGMEHCIFGDGKVIRCSKDELKARVNYTGSDPKVCSISVSGVTEGGKFECSIDGESPKGAIEVTLAARIEKIEIRVGNESEGYLEAGKPGPIFCVLSGGKPLGESNITTSAGLNITSDETSVIQGPKGQSTSSHKIMIQTQVKDHGVQINCTGHQFDNSDPKKELFTDSKAKPVSLVVVFPPQPVEGLAYTGTFSEELKITVPVHSNPSPDTFKWMTKRKINGTDTTTELTNGDKFKIPKICTHVGENRKNCSLTIKNFTKEDSENVSYEFEIENKFGKALIPFKVRSPNVTVTPAPGSSSVSTSASTTPGNSSTSSSGTTPPSNSTSSPSTSSTAAPEGGSTSSYVIPLVIFIVIIIVLIGGMIAYKRYSARRQTAPMSMQ